MGLRDIPATYEEFEALHDEYEAKHVTYTPEAAQLWQATQGRLVELLVFWLPPRLRRWCEPVAKRVLPVLLSDGQRRAFGIAPPSRLWRSTVYAGLKLRSWRVRWSKPRIEPAAAQRRPTRTYPTAEYEINQLGPAHSVRAPDGDEGHAGVGGLAQQIADLSEAEREHRLAELVRTQVAGVMGRAGHAATARGQPFTALGLDSVAAVKVRDRLGGLTGLTLPATLLFDYPTPEALARYLAERLTPAAASGGDDDPEERRVRDALATIPLSRLRQAGLLGPLLALTGLPDYSAADQEGDDLIRMAFDNPEP
jgi:hypothetical protein